MPTKIEKFQAQRSIAQKVKADRDKAFGLDAGNNDKHSVSVRFVGLTRNSGGGFSAMNFVVEASYGYYGSSSGYDATSRELGEYLAKAIYAHRRELFDDAVTLAKAEAEVARAAARDEARDVLEVTTGDDDDGK